MAAAIALFASARAGRLYALIHQSRGGMELGAIVAFAVFAVVLIFAVRRRHVSAWKSTVHVMGSLVAGNAMALVLIWPFVPEGYGMALTEILRETISAGTVMAVLTLPVSIAMLWLSRRYGSGSEVTERRLRVVRGEARQLDRPQDATEA